MSVGVERLCDEHAMAVLAASLRRYVALELPKAAIRQRATVLRPDVPTSGRVNSKWHYHAPASIGPTGIAGGVESSPSSALALGEGVLRGAGSAMAAGGLPAGRVAEALCAFSSG